MNITAVIISLNEQKNIKECIESFGELCDEVIVVDSGSKDDTVNIAESLGAKVYHQPYLGDGIQKNVGLQYAKNNWILSLDADERLTNAAIKEVQSLNLVTTNYDAFAFKRKNFIGSRWIKVCGWYPDYVTRLYNKDKTRFAEVKAHSKVTTDNFKKLNSDIIHYSYNHVGELFSKADRFSTRGAKIHFQNGRRANRFSPITHGLSAFFSMYIIRKGFLQGLDGLSIALSSGVSSYLKYAKLLEFQNDPSSKARLENKNLWE